MLDRQRFLIWSNTVGWSKRCRAQVAQDLIIVWGSLREEGWGGQQMNCRGNMSPGAIVVLPQQWVCYPRLPPALFEPLNWPLTLHRPLEPANKGFTASSSCISQRMWISSWCYGQADPSYPTDRLISFEIVLWRSFRLQPAWDISHRPRRRLVMCSWALGLGPSSTPEWSASISLPRVPQRFPLADRCLLGNWTTSAKNRLKLISLQSPSNEIGRRGKRVGSFSLAGEVHLADRPTASTAVCFVPAFSLCHSFSIWQVMKHIYPFLTLSVRG